MGNRANICFEAKDGRIGPAVYLHCNGGPESIYQFLDEMDRRNIRFGDIEYETARFAHIVGDFFDENEATSLSLGVTNGPASDSDDDVADIDSDLSDSGVYIVRRNGPGDRTVKRYVKRADVLRRMTDTEVEAEREAAYKSDYATKDGGFVAIFKKLRPEISRYG